MASNKTITFVTGNAKKLEEFLAILGNNFPHDIVSMQVGGLGQIVYTLYDSDVFVEHGYLDDVDKTKVVGRTCGDYCKVESIINDIMRGS